MWRQLPAALEQRRPAMWRSIAEPVLRRLAPACTLLGRSTESDVKHAHREIMNHQRLLHPHVVQLKEVGAAPAAY